jgi:hypothetical protein
LRLKIRDVGAAGRFEIVQRSDVKSLLSSLVGFHMNIFDDAEVLRVEAEIQLLLDIIIF